MKAAVVGSGIAGSAARRALMRLGADVKVYERAPELFAVGAGLTLAPNGLAVIDQLGLLDEIKSVAQTERVVNAFDHRGHQMGGTTFAFCERAFRYPLVGLSRHDLQTILMGDAQPGVDVILGKKCVRIEDAESMGKSRIRFEDGTVSEWADLIVGADGQRSAVGEYVTGMPADQLLQYSGNMSTFGITKEASFPEAQSGVITWVFGEGKNWGTWCLPGGRYFWFTITKSLVPTTASWSGKLLEDVKAEFRGSFHPAQGGFDAVLDATERATTIALCDKAGHTVNRGRVCLVGDAAHALTPWGGQGANLALEDAAELANCLVKHRADVLKALQSFNDVRVTRGREIAAFSRRTGNMQMSQEWWGPLARRLMLNAPTWVTEKGIAWIYSHQIKLLNAHA